MRSVVFACLFTLGACGNSSTRVAEPRAAGEHRPDAGTAATTEAAIALRGGANALLWEPATSTLYLTDNNTGSVMKWTDAGGLATVAELPQASAGVSLGDLVRRPDGSLLVASFGFGSQGTVFALAPDGTSRALTGLDPARRRIGLAQGADGALYTAYFVGGGHHTPVGGVSTLTVAGDHATETEIAGPFKKVVGLVATPAALFVADQADKAIFRIALPGYAVSKLASVPDVDLLAMMPDGDLLAGGRGTLSRVTQAGAVTVLAVPGVEQVRGLAYDAARGRLFIVDHSATVGVPDKLRIQPL